MFWFESTYESELTSLPDTCPETFMGKPNHNKLKRSPTDINGQPEAHRIFVTKDYFVSLVTNSNFKKTMFVKSIHTVSCRMYGFAN